MTSASDNKSKINNLAAVATAQGLLEAGCCAAAATHQGADICNALASKVLLSACDVRQTAGITPSVRIVEDFESRG